MLSFLAFAAVADELAAAARVQLAPQALPIADFTLTDQDGKPFAFSKLQGSNVLVFFGFTSCPSICPTAMYKLKLVTEAVRKDGGAVPKVVLISVDGDRDTPGVMKDYVGRFSDRFLGLTGDPKDVRKIAAQFKAVFFKGLPSDNSGSYLVEHSSQVYLMDAKGRLRATFFDAGVEEMVKVTRSVDEHAS